MNPDKECVNFDDLEPAPFNPYTAVEFKRRSGWSQRYVGNNLLWGEHHWIELRRGETYMDWNDFLGPLPLDDFEF